MSDHHDALDEQLKDLEDTLTIAANAMAGAPNIIRSVQKDAFHYVFARRPREDYP